MEKISKNDAPGKTEGARDQAGDVQSGVRVGQGSSLLAPQPYFDGGGVTQRISGAP